MTHPFDYPVDPHQRKHGPRGYFDYRSYKPWLRDEFCFRCVYCMTRKQWCPDGDARLRPPGGNARHDGVESSIAAIRDRGELAPTY